MRRRRIATWHSAAVVIRFAAFISAAAGIIMLPATIVATTSGHMSHQGALILGGTAVALVVTSVLIVRPFDPLRG